MKGAGKHTNQEQALDPQAGDERNQERSEKEKKEKKKKKKKKKKEGLATRGTLLKITGLYQGV